LPVKGYLFRIRGNSFDFFTTWRCCPAFMTAKQEKEPPAPGDFFIRPGFKLSQY
jgi:hypothetical protein